VIRILGREGQRSEVVRQESGCCTFYVPVSTFAVLDQNDLPINAGVRNDFEQPLWNYVTTSLIDTSAKLELKVNI